MMLELLIIGLAILSGLLLYINRPREHWSGLCSANFMCALVILCYALLLLSRSQAWALEPLSWLQQFVLYAIVPVMLTSQTCLIFKQNWSRLIWGRILLAWCVVYELCRRNELLEDFFILLLISAVIICVLRLLKDKKNIVSSTVLLLGWITIAAAWIQDALPYAVVSLPFCITLLHLLSLYRK